MEAVQKAEVESSAAMNWFYGEYNGVVSLSFQVPESDGIAINLDCPVGSGRITVKEPAATSAPRIVRLRSDGGEIRLPAKAEPDPQTDDLVFLKAEIAASDPVMSGFRATNALESLSSGEPGRYAARLDAPRRIATFFARCGNGLRGKA